MQDVDIYMIYQSHYNLNADIYQQSYSHHHAAIFTQIFNNYRSQRIGEAAHKKIRVRYTTIFLAENKLTQME